MDAGEARRRLFVGVPLPKELLAFALAAQDLLPGDPRVKKVGAAQLHCTLAFIGAAGAPETEAAGHVVRDLPEGLSGEALIDGIVFLPSRRRARVVALSVDDRQGALEALYEAVVTGMVAAGVMSRESRPFRAHITIARVRRPGPVQLTSDCGCNVFGVESVCLYDSECRPEGAVYTVLERKDLQRA